MHDATVASVRLALPTSDFLVTGEASTLCVTLEGVESFGVKGFRDGAIIDTLYAFELDGSPEPPPQAWETLWAGDCKITDPGSESTIRLAKERSRFLVLLECSYGGSLAWLCREVRLTRDTKR